MSQKISQSKGTLKKRLKWEDLDPDYLRQIVGLAKIEDLAGAGLAARPARLGDVTAALMPEGANGQAQLTTREPLIICGLGLLPIILESYGADCSFEPQASDGDLLKENEAIGTLNGSATVLLQAERVILNFLQ